MQDIRKSTENETYATGGEEFKPFLSCNIMLYIKITCLRKKELTEHFLLFKVSHKPIATPFISDVLKSMYHLCY